jgi:hypothetical protein
LENLLFQGLFKQFGRFKNVEMILAEDDAMFDLIRLNGGINQHPFA